MANSYSGQIVTSMALNCSDDDEECDVSQRYNTDFKNIEDNENLFYMNVIID